MIQCVSILLMFKRNLSMKNVNFVFKTMEICLN